MISGIHSFRFVRILSSFLPVRLVVWRSLEIEKVKSTPYKKEILFNCVYPCVLLLPVRFLMALYIKTKWEEQKSTKNKMKKISNIVRVSNKEFVCLFIPEENQEFWKCTNFSPYNSHINSIIPYTWNVGIRYLF